MAVDQEIRGIVVNHRVASINDDRVSTLKAWASYMRCRFGGDEGAFPSHFQLVRAYERINKVNSKLTRGTR